MKLNKATSHPRYPPLNLYFRQYLSSRNSQDFAIHSATLPPDVDMVNSFRENIKTPHEVQEQTEKSSSTSKAEESKKAESKADSLPSINIKEEDSISSVERKESEKESVVKKEKDQNKKEQVSDLDKLILNNQEEPKLERKETVHEKDNIESTVQMPEIENNLNQDQSSHDSDSEKEDQESEASSLDSSSEGFSPQNLIKLKTVQEKSQSEPL